MNGTGLQGRATLLPVVLLIILFMASACASLVSGNGSLASDATATRGSLNPAETQAGGQPTVHIATTPTLIATASVPTPTPVATLAAETRIAVATPPLDQAGATSVVETPARAGAAPTTDPGPVANDATRANGPAGGADDPVVVAVGDIADCEVTGDEATAALITDPSWTLATLGDTVYESGTALQFANCYDPAWGAYKSQTRPAIGNHEYHVREAAGYFDYFGAAAGDRDKGYYSYDLGGWHVIVLNSNCSQVGSCVEDSPQVQWLQADLAAHPARCTLAYWHHPVFGSTGTFTDFPDMLPIWRILYDAGAEIVLTGHAHNYERLAPLDAEGKVDEARGIRQWVVGTGGKSRQEFVDVAPYSEARNDQTFGVLKLTLRPDGYDWEFMPVAGESYTDSGTGTCH